MKKTLLILFIVLTACRASAQHKVFVDSVPKVVPHYFISTDIVYDAESIPVICFEKFFVTNNRLKSWQIDAGYQMHYSNQFGIALSHGDNISAGVYQGPAVKFGYNIYSHRHRKNWMNYCSPVLGVKYLWYNDEQVNTGKRSSDPSYRVQSEQCVAAVPGFQIGAKHTDRYFCADFYVGLQTPVKFRDKTIYQQYNSQLVPDPNVPYNANQVTFAIAPVFGIRLGLIK
jgi:hypothetical protein